MTDVRALSKRAGELANENTPGVVLENLFFGFFTVIGMVLGRAWFYASKMVYIIGLAFIDGYKRGAKFQPKVPQPIAAPPPAPDMPALMDDGRTHDAYTTPFGVPFGPNVQAWSEPA